MGRVDKVLPSKDGLVRTCKICTLNGLLTRPIQRLVLIEKGQGVLLNPH